MRSKFNQEMKEWIKDNAPYHLNKELTDLFNAHFCTCFSIAGIRSIKKKMGARCEIKKYKREWTNKRRVKYTPEMIEWLKNNSYGKFNREIAEDFNKHFGTNYEVKSISYKRKDLRIKSNVHETGRWAPGCEKTWFKKGNIPGNTLPVGYEYKRQFNGIHFIKVANPNVWMTKQDYVWEKAHGMKVPDNHVVTFLDGNKDNFDLKNLILITRAEHSYLNINHLRSDDPELTQANILVYRLKKKIKEIK